MPSGPDVNFTTSDFTKMCHSYFRPQDDLAIVQDSKASETDKKTHQRQRTEKICSYIFTFGIAPLVMGIVYGCSLLHDFRAFKQRKKAALSETETTVQDVARAALPVANASFGDNLSWKLLSGLEDLLTKDRAAFVANIEESVSERTVVDGACKAICSSNMAGVKEAITRFMEGRSLSDELQQNLLMDLIRLYFQQRNQQESFFAPFPLDLKATERDLEYKKIQFPDDRGRELSVLARIIEKIGKSSTGPSVTVLAKAIAPYLSPFSAGQDAEEWADFFAGYMEMRIHQMADQREEKDAVKDKVVDDPKLAPAAQLGQKKSRE